MIVIMKEARRGNDIKKRYRKDSEHHAKEYRTPVNNQTYFDECGACHFAYQPGLLPTGSWEKIVARLDDHFGEQIVIDMALKNVIRKYLIAYSEANSFAKRAIKIKKPGELDTPSNYQNSLCSG